MCWASLLKLLLIAEKDIWYSWWDCQLGLPSKLRGIFWAQNSPRHHLNHCGVVWLRRQWILKEHMLFLPFVIESLPNRTVQLNKLMSRVLLLSGNHIWEISTGSSLMNITYHTVRAVRSFYQWYWHFTPGISQYWWQCGNRMLELKSLSQLMHW